MAAALSYGADALWIVALTIMAAVSRAAMRRIEPGERVPVLFDAKGAPRTRAPRDAALWLIPGLSLILSLGLLWAHRTLAGDIQIAVMMFGLRATLAALLALAHLTWLNKALAALAAEGKLKP